MFFFAKTVMSDKKPTDEEKAGHREYLKVNGHRILGAGPTFDEHKPDPEGSILIFEADGWQSAKDFVESDPFFIAGIRKEVKIQVWLPGGYARTYPVDASKI